MEWLRAQLMLISTVDGVAEGMVDAHLHGGWSGWGHSWCPSEQWMEQLRAQLMPSPWQGSSGMKMHEWWPHPLSKDGFWECLSILHYAFGKACLVKEMASLSYWLSQQSNPFKNFPSYCPSALQNYWSQSILGHPHSCPLIISLYSEIQGADIPSGESQKVCLWLASLLYLYIITHPKDSDSPEKICPDHCPAANWKPRST